MALPLANNAEGGSNTTAVSTGNSGAASGDAWTAVTPDTGSAIAFSSTQARDTLAYAYTMDASIGQSIVQWGSASVGTAGPNIYGRFYGWFPAFPTSGLQVVMRLLSGASIACGVCLSTTGGVQLRAGAAGNTNAGTETVTKFVLSSWFRVEWQFNLAASGSGSATLYTSPDSTTDPGANASTSFSATTTGGVTTINTVNVGLMVNGTASSTFYLDNIQVNSTGRPGPVPAAQLVMAPYMGAF